MIIKKGFVFAFILILIILNCSFIYSLGLSPALIELNFEPGEKYFINFQPRNVEVNQKLRVYAIGDFNDSVRFDKTNLIGEEGFTAYIDLPMTAKKPGNNYLYIRVSEVKDKFSGIGTLIEVGALVLIRVPYPGRYAEIKSFMFENVNENEPINYEIEVVNYGEEELNIYADIEVYSNDKFIDRYSLGNEILSPAKSKTFKKTIYEGYPAGDYNITAIVSYGEKTIEQSRVLRVGNLFVDILNSTPELEKGKISPYEVEIESKWNNEIPNVYAEVNISKEGIEKSFFKTVSRNLKGWERNILTGFLDAEDLEVGEYDAEITLFYGGETNMEKTKLFLKKPAEEIKIIIYIALAIGIAVLILIIILFGLFWIFKKNKSKNLKVFRLSFLNK